MVEENVDPLNERGRALRGIPQETLDGRGRCASTFPRGRRPPDPIHEKKDVEEIGDGRARALGALC
eukprot:7853509-Lingulodinium_polyedra.AAC.1